MTNEKTDNTDEPSKADLHDRVQQLESTVAKMMPSRRDALRMGAAGLAGAAGLGATTQPADASTGSAGTIGTSSDRPDLLTDEVDANILKTDRRDFGQKSKGFTVPLEFPSAGFKDILRFNHTGQNNRTVIVHTDFVACDILAETSVSETDNIAFTRNNDGDWGTTGSIITVSSNVRLKVDSNDNQILRLQVDIPDDLMIGFIRVNASTASGDNLSLINEVLN